MDGVTCLASAELPTRHGLFRMDMFAVDGVVAEFPALIRGNPGQGVPLVRLHSECLTGEVLGSLRCDCGPQLETSLERIAATENGILLYLRQEGRGIGLANKIRAYALQDGGLDTVDANIALGLPIDCREYASSARVLHFLGVRRVRLLTNNLAKCQALESHGVQVLERIPLEIAPNATNSSYLRTKAMRMGHTLSCPEPDPVA